MLLTESALQVLRKGNDTPVISIHDHKYFEKSKLFKDLLELFVKEGNRVFEASVEAYDSDGDPYEISVHRLTVMIDQEAYDTFQNNLIYTVEGLSLYALLEAVFEAPGDEQPAADSGVTSVIALDMINPNTERVFATLLVDCGEEMNNKYRHERANRKKKELIEQRDQYKQKIKQIDQELNLLE